MTGVDGIIQIVDSRLKKLEANELNFQRTKDLLKLTRANWGDVPLVFQYNHRDSNEALDLKALKKAFSRHNSGSIEAVAAQDIGVFESLDSIADRILVAMEKTPTLMDREGLGLYLH